MIFLYNTFYNEMCQTIKSENVITDKAKEL